MRLDPCLSSPTTPAAFRAGAQAAELQESAGRKDEFPTLAHELRNPLAPISTGLQMLKVSGAAAGADDRTLTIMERQVNHMVRLIDDLLDVGRVTYGRSSWHGRDSI